MPKIAKELSAIEVKRIKSPGMHFVGGVAGLALQLKNSEAASWILRVRIGGKRKHIGLGGFPQVTLAEARGAAKNQPRRRLLHHLHPRRSEERHRARRFRQERRERPPRRPQNPRLRHQRSRRQNRTQAPSSRFNLKNDKSPTLNRQSLRAIRCGYKILGRISSKRFHSLLRRRGVAARTRV